MTSKPWIPLSYAKNSELPLPGEVIILPLSIDNIDFPHGPVSHFTPSNHCSKAGSSTGDLTRVTDELYFVLVINVKHREQEIKVFVLPIVSYSSPPNGRTTPSWDPDQWMSQEATKIQRLHHLPIPAINWTPSPPLPLSHPVLSFGGWKNDHPSWVAMIHVIHKSSEVDQWFRHPDGPVILDGGSSTIKILYDLLTCVLPTAHLEAADLVHSVPMTDEEIEYALEQHHLGIEGVDPVSFWNMFKPQKLREYDQQQEKIFLDEKVTKWQEACVAEGSKEYLRGTGAREIALAKLYMEWSFLGRVPLRPTRSFWDYKNLMSVCTPSASGINNITIYSKANMRDTRC